MGRNHHRSQIMTAEEAKYLVKEYLRQYVSERKPEIWVGEIVASDELGFTVEGGIYGPGMQKDSNSAWFEVDAATRSVDLCPIG